MTKYVEVEYAKLKKRLQKMRSNASNPYPLTAKIAVFADKDVKDHFSQSQGPGGKWKPIKHRTGKPLLDTGRLRGSLRKSNAKDYAKISTNLVYAGIHNFGGKAGRNRKVSIPKRQYMWISNKMSDIITKMVGKFYIGGA